MLYIFLLFCPLPITPRIKMCLWFDSEALMFGLGDSMEGYGEVIEKSWKTITKKVYEPWPPCPYALAQLRRDTEVLRLRKCSAKRKANLTAMQSGVEFLYTTYTWTDINFLGEPCFRWLNFTFSLDLVHCSTQLSVWAGAALYFSKLRLCWSVITVGNRSTIDMYFIWPHLKKHKLSL